jgi:hypothetical protein
MVFRDYIEYMFHFLMESAHHIVSAVLYPDKNVQNNDMEAENSYYYMYKTSYQYQTEPS